MTSLNIWTLGVHRGKYDWWQQSDCMMGSLIDGDNDISHAFLVLARETEKTPWWMILFSYAWWRPTVTMLHSKNSSQACHCVYNNNWYEPGLQTLCCIRSVATSAGRKEKVAVFILFVAVSCFLATFHLWRENAQYTVYAFLHYVTCTFSTLCMCFAQTIYQIFSAQKCKNNNKTKQKHTAYFFFRISFL